MSTRSDETLAATALTSAGAPAPVVEPPELRSCPSRSRSPEPNGKLLPPLVPDPVGRDSGPRRRWCRSATWRDRRWPRGAGRRRRRGWRSPPPVPCGCAPWPAGPAGPGSTRRATGATSWAAGRHPPRHPIHRVPGRVPDRSGPIPVRARRPRCRARASGPRERPGPDGRRPGRGRPRPPRPTGPDRAPRSEAGRAAPAGSAGAAGSPSGRPAAVRPEAPGAVGASGTSARRRRRSATHPRPLRRSVLLLVAVLVHLVLPPGRHDLRDDVTRPLDRSSLSRS